MTGTSLKFIDTTDSTTKASVTQTGIDMNNNKITNLNDPSNPTDAINLRTGDLRYNFSDSNVTLSRNALTFNNTAEVLVSANMSASKPITLKDSSTN